jgi:hypothetical protein
LVSKGFLSVLISVGELGPAVTTRKRKGEDFPVIGEVNGSISVGHSKGHDPVAVALETPALNGVSALKAVPFGQPVEHLDQSRLGVHADSIAERIEA